MKQLRLSTGPHLLARDTTQRIMLDVLIAMVPTAAAGIYLFGYQAAILIAVAIASAVLAEGLWQKLTGQDVLVWDLSAAVTGAMMGMNVPTTSPWWMVALGSVAAIILVKQMFGGLGHNFLNPVLAARTILLVSWPAKVTTFHAPVRTIQVGGLGMAATAVDGVTSATPMATQDTAIIDLLLGNITGSIGEVCKIAILIGFVYLLIRRVIGPHIPLLYVGTVALLSWLMGQDPLRAILSGSLLYGAVFMATDYVTNPMFVAGQCVFAVGCGVLTVVIRNGNGYTEGVMFAILLMNIVTPLIDRVSRRRVYGTRGEVKVSG